jgi:signal transduction histidine kinase
LREKSTAKDGLAERAEALVGIASPLLDLVVAGPFREYTLHNPAHSKKLIHLCEYLMPERTLDALSALELLLVIDSCYLHDLGMVLTSDERLNLLNSPDFQDTLRTWPTILQELQATRLQAEAATAGDRLRIETRLYQLQEAALAAHLRTIHATQGRYVDLVRMLKESSGRADLFEVDGVSYENELIEICVSHNLDVGALLERRGTYEDRFPRDLALSGYRVNMQFCAALLRLTDILDFDRERTPKILFESLGIGDSNIPGANVSLREWNKHLAVHTIGLGETELVISADSSHPAIERSVRDFCALIEREIRDTSSVLRRNPPDIGDTYRVDIPLTVRPQVRSIGYVYRDFAFRLNESSISKILMGEGLYANKAVALRELIQNSIDACRVKALLTHEAGYKPSITVSHFEDSDHRFWIEVSDNGVGMDEFVLSNYFFRVGDSYYASSDFGRILRNRSFTPISRFGIGALSVFMIGDILEVATRNVDSPRGDTAYRTARIEGRFGLAFVTEAPTGPAGTRVRLRLTFETHSAALLFFSQAATYLRDIVRRPLVPIDVSFPYTSFTLEAKPFFRLNHEKLGQLQTMRIEPLVLDIAEWSQQMSGTVVIFFHARPDGSLSRSDGSGKVLIQNKEMAAFLSDYVGNRLTVNGISMAIKKLGHILGAGSTGKERFAVAMDVEVPGKEDIHYDVARNKVVGSGVLSVRRELRSAIVRGLRGSNIFDRLDQETKSALTSPKWPVGFGPGASQDLPEEVLAAVRELVPKKHWPVGMHRMIADELGISPSIAHRAISTLIAAGLIHKGYSSSPGGSAESTVSQPPDDRTGPPK